MGFVPRGCATMLVLSLELGWAVGCDGRVDAGPAGPSDAPSSSADPSSEPTPPGSGIPSEPPAFECDRDAPIDPGPAPLQRLTPAQYLASVQALFGTDLNLADVLPPEASAGHVGLAQPDPSQVDVERYVAAARRTAEHVEARVETFAPCDPVAAVDRSAATGCARAFLGRFGERVYRSPLTNADIDRLLAIFDLGFQGDGYGHGLGLMVEAMLQSPRFLYRPELGDDTRATPSAAPLTAYERAARLSFAFWNRGPDEPLLEAAASGALDSPEGMAEQARRLAADPRADQSFRDFLRVWLGLGDWDTVEKDPVAFPMWTETTRAAVNAQAEAFFDAALFGREGTLRSLFTLDPTELASEDMAAWRTRGEGSAPGVLALPALLSRHSKPTESFPIYRGLFVREQLLCQTLPPPPSNVGEPPEPARGVSSRQRFEQHSKDPACKGCHTLIDPLGFAFEGYDAIGRIRTSDEGHRIDASGQLVGTDVDGAFENLAELSAMLAESDTVRACVARQWFRFVMQRFEQPADGCSMQKLSQDFAASGYRFDALRTAIVEAPAFLMRRPIAPEGETP